MDEVISGSDREVLVEVVRLAQKQGLKGVEGGWKDFLNSHDKKFGAGLSDPAKRSMDILVAFVKTFTQERDLKLFSKLIRRHHDYKAMEQFIKNFPDRESPQQKLVRLTVEHPQYIQRYTFPSHDEEWIVLRMGKISKAMKSKNMISIDCEMVLCQDGTEAVVKVCAVDNNLKAKLDKVVNPNKAIADYRSGITGISAKDLQGVTCSLSDVQKSLKKLLSHGTILVGHSLHKDLHALKIDHPRVIDTTCIFKYKDLPTGYSPSLNSLCKSVLGYEVRKEGEPHNCLNDAQAAMKLVLAKLEHGVDDPIAVAGNNVSNHDLAKLLLHRIPAEVPCLELQNLFSQNCSVDIQTDLRIHGQYYSTFAIFKDDADADAAFRRIEGPENKDSSGRLQKNVSLRLSTGRTITFFVRTMTADKPLNEGAELSNKRLSQGDGEDPDSKRQRMCLQSHNCEHVKEIEDLKEKLRKREEEIFSLQKILSALTRKHGL